MQGRRRRGATADECSTSVDVFRDSVRSDVRSTSYALLHFWGPRHSSLVTADGIWACFETRPEDVLTPGMFRRDEQRRAAHVGWTRAVDGKFSLSCVEDSCRMARGRAGRSDREANRLNLCWCLPRTIRELPSYIQPSIFLGQRKHYLGMCALAPLETQKRGLLVGSLQSHPELSH